MRSPHLSATRHQVIALFHSEVDAKRLSAELGVSPKSIRKWWTEEYGKESVKARGKAILLKLNVARGRPITDSKRCPKCQEVKPLTLYNKRESSRDGHRDWCAPCERALVKQYRESLSPETKAERAERKNAYNQSYRVAHLDKLLAYEHQYRESHRESLRSKTKKFYTQYPERLLFQLARKRARDYGVPFSVTPESILALIPEDGRCPITLESFERGVGKVGARSMTLDRIIPKLGYVQGNVGIISHLANTIKSNCISVEVFYRIADFLEKGACGVGGVRPRDGTKQPYRCRPEVRLYKSAQQRARDRGIPFSITVEDVRLRIPLDGCCPITRENFEQGTHKAGPRSMSLDRINPTLGYTPKNIAVISHLANTIKQNITDPDVFRRVAKYLEGTLIPSTRVT